MTVYDNSDLILWPDGDFCLAEDLDDFGWKSDDYERIPFDSDRWHKYFSEIAFA